MSAGTLAMALAAFFTFGCITIHEARQHARAMTPGLALAAVCLGLFVGLVAMADRGENDDRHAAAAPRSGRNAPPVEASTTRAAQAPRR